MALQQVKHHIHSYCKWERIPSAVTAKHGAPLHKFIAEDGCPVPLLAAEYSLIPQLIPLGKIGKVVDCVSPFFLKKAEVKCMFYSVP